MQNKRPWLPSVTVAAALAAAVAAPAASAAGFGAAPSSAVLGQTLDFTVTLRLDAGELPTSDCISADVTVGDRRLPAALVRVNLQPAGADAARVHVVTTQAIDEPVVAVQVSAACSAARIVQRFVLFADPPMVAAPVTLVTAPAFAAMPAAVPTDGAGVVVDAPPSRGGVSSAADTAPITQASQASQAAQAAQVVQAATLRERRTSTGAVAQSTQLRNAEGAVGATTVAARGDAASGAFEAGAARGERRAQPAETTQPRPRRAALAARAASSPSRSGAGGAAAATTALALTAQAPTAVAASATPPAPRLKLDAPEPVVSSEDMVIDQALQAVAEAASAARAAASAASATAARIAALERTVDALRADASGSRDLAAQLSEKLARSENGGHWLWPLIAVAVLLALLAAWLARRLAITQQARQLDWQAAAGDAAPARLGGAPVPPLLPAAAGEPPPDRRPTAPVPFVASVPGRPDTRPAAAGRRPGTAPQQASPGQPASVDAGGAATRALDVQAAAPPSTFDVASTPQEPVSNRTQPMPPSFSVAAGAATQPAIGFATAAETPQAPRPSALPGTNTSRLAAGGAQRDVTIEELIDLEQQAEFFVVLGQDDAATELLVEHLGNTGGGSPLPYLKLMEIYRRRGERADYERMRTRFNHRFNAYAPEWGVDLQAGRTLEYYTGVIPRLQQVWVRPLDAMAELEALLFRKSRGDLFDLPAYREVLFLYSLARDLVDHEASDTGNVDLLLPLADGGEFSSTSPAPFLAQGASPSTGADPAGTDDRATAPLDFDLSSDIGSTASIFDRLDEPVTALPPPFPPSPSPPPSPRR